MPCSFGEGTNERFEEEEKRFQSEDNKVKFFHTFYRNRIKHIFSSGNNRDITTLNAFKTFQRKHQFAAKANLLHYNGTTQEVGHENTNNAMQVEAMDENDDMITISFPEPKWYNERKYYAHDDLYSLDG